MTWTILLVKRNDNGWFINYIENKLINQINKCKLQNSIQVLVFDANINFNTDFISVIDEEIEISDNFILTVYSALDKKYDSVGLKGVVKVDDIPIIFNNISKTDNEVYLPITKLNPIKTEFIFNNLKNIIYYINSQIINVRTIKHISESVVFLEKITKKIPFSIIITAYKTEKYIEECLDSIEKQTYFIDNDEYEILVGVDGCQDTLNKLEEIKGKYRNLHIHMMPENKGTYITTNTLLNFIRYENALRFDSDDIMTPNMISEIVKDKKDNDIIILGSVDYQNNRVGNKLLLTEGSIYFKKSVMDNVLGGYMPWRCSADTELINRAVNNVKISQIKKSLFYRRIHSESLTQRKDTGYNSDIRNEYKKQIKFHYDSDEIKIERVVSEIFQIKTKNAKLISINMATFPERKDIFIKCINQLLNIDIIDIIRVYLNEYTNIPPEFPKSEKITYLIGDKNLKDTGKFYWSTTLNDEYYFTIDDDFLYSKTYFENHLDILKRYNNKIFVTTHGKIMQKNPKQINDFIEYYHVLNENKKDEYVNSVGTGVMLFDNSVHSFPLDIFKYNGMCDLFISVYCQKNKIPIICRKHDKNEVKLLPTINTLFDQRKEMSKQHLEILNSVKEWKIYQHEKRISIVTSYYNRKKLFYETLKSISKTKYSNFEVVVVDDGSDKHERLEDLKNEFGFLKVIRIEKEDKWYKNPCIPFNIGIKSLTGDIIILQNPECYHVNDILTYAYENSNDSNYLSISTYALDKKLTAKFLKIENKKEFFQKLPQQEFVGETLLGWYNHSKYRPVYYHFCSIMTKNSMNLLGGFDERYADGIAFDDNEILERINRLKLNTIICDNVSVVHLYHDSIYYNMKDYLSYHKKNELMYEITKKENIINVNDNKPIIKDKQIPKRIFFYWCGDNFSWMRYMTLYSFRKMNPDWEIVLYRSNNPNRKKTWSSYEKQDFSKKIEINYFDKLKDLNIKIEPVVFPEDVAPHIKDMSLIHESDLFRYYELYKNGGIYCDTDVLFFRPIDNFYNMLVENNYDTIFAQSEWVTIGFLGSVKNNELYKNLFETGVYNYKNKVTDINYDINSYQSMGAELIYKIFNKKNWKSGSYYSNVLNEIIKRYPYLNIYNLPNSIIYHYDWRTPNEVFSNAYGIDTFDLDSIGYHWFGGSDESNKYNTILTENNFYDYKTTFSEIAKKII